MNTLKTFILMFLMVTVFTWIGYSFGGEQGMIIALLFATFSNFIMYWFSDKIVLTMYRAKEVKDGDASEILRVVRNLVVKENIPQPKVYLIQSPAPNAFATGRNPHHASVAVTSGIMEMLTAQELEAVVAHELSHVKHRDILISTIAATFAAAITMLARLGHWALLFGGFGRRSDDRDGGDGLGMLLTIILAPIAAVLIQLAISRSREYLADKGSAQMTRQPLALASALRKLEEAGKRVPLAANPSTAHMFTVSPLRGGGMLSLFSTHPPVAKRIAELEKLDKDLRMSGMPKIIS